MPSLKNSINFSELSEEKYGDKLASKELHKIHWKLFSPLYASKRYRARNSNELINEYVDIIRREVILNFLTLWTRHV